MYPKKRSFKKSLPEIYYITQYYFQRVFNSKKPKGRPTLILISLSWRVTNRYHMKRGRQMSYYVVKRKTWVERIVAMVGNSRMMTKGSFINHVDTRGSTLGENGSEFSTDTFLCAKMDQFCKSQSFLWEEPLILDQKWGF